MHGTTVGLDLAKTVFQVHGITAAGEVAFNRPLRRAQVLAFFARLDPCLVGIEACGTSHYWARELTKLGHEVRLIPPMYVKAYVKRGKSDAIDAEAVCEAVTRPTMRFVEIKSVDRQALLSLHRARALIARQRSCEPREQAGHKSASDQCNHRIKKGLLCRGHPHKAVRAKGEADILLRPFNHGRGLAAPSGPADVPVSDAPNCAKASLC